MIDNQELLLDDRQLRDANVARFEVLEKVKELLLIPSTELATVQQVANYYEVGLEAIKTLVKVNREELQEDGLQNMTGTETKGILARSDSNLANFRGYFMVGDIKFNNRNNLLFPRRAILRVGMLLRDSTIAREVRTQLLNIEAKTSKATKVADIEEEKALLQSIGLSYASGNIESLLLSTKRYNDFQNRHIQALEEVNTKLETTNKALANGILEWEDRSRLNFAVRKLSQFTGIYYSKLWNELYKQLKNGYHIDLKARGNKPWIQHINEQEWQTVIKCFSALCQYYDHEPADMFNDLKVT